MLALNEQGLFERWSFAPANHHEAAVAPGLTESIGKPIIGDKAYLCNYRITTPKRKNTIGADRWNKALNRIRKRTETSFGALVGSLTLRRSGQNLSLT